MVMDTLVSEARSIQFDSLKLKQGEQLFYGSASSANVSIKGDGHQDVTSSAPSKLVQEIAQTRKLIEQSLNEPLTHVAKGHGGADAALVHRVETLEGNNAEMKNELKEMRSLVQQLEKQISTLVPTFTALLQQKAGADAAAEPPSVIPKSSAKKEEAGDDDEEDVDLFGSDDEEVDEEAEKLKAERLAAYAQKKSAKPGVIAKSNIVLDVKPWDDETDMAEVEKACRAIEVDGLKWGAAKLVPLAYGIKKLQICCVVEDDKVSIDELTENIESNDELVQSVDIAAFNKI